MKQVRKNKAANFEGAGGGTAAEAGNTSPSNPIILPNPPVCQVGPIPTAAGGPTCWGVCDALATFRRELEQAGIVKADDPQVWAAQVRAWQVMGQEASYLSARDKEAWPEMLGEVEQ